MSERLNKSAYAPVEAVFDHPARRRLYLSRIDDRFDPRLDVPLGPWCFQGAEDRSPGWEALVADRAHDEIGRTTDPEPHIASLISYLIGKLAADLNARHGRSYGYAYWWCLLAPWLSYLVPVAWRRWRWIAAFVERHRDEPFEVSILANADSINWRFPSFDHLVGSGINSEPFDFWIFSVFLQHLAPPAWRLIPVHRDDLTEIVNITPLYRGRTNRVKALLRRLLGRIPFIDVPGVGGIASIMFSLFIFLLPRRLNAQVFFGEVEKRVPGSFPTPFLDALQIVLTATEPLAIGKKFSAYEAMAAAYRYRPGRLFVTAPSLGNDNANFCIAHAIESGERVVRVQHGCNYGTIENPIAIQFTEYCGAAFLTWGWSSHGSSTGRFIPIPAPELSRIRDRHRERSRAILLVGGFMLPRPYLPHFPEPPDAVDARARKVTFMRSLAATVSRDVYYRPYGNARYALEDGPYLQRAIPWIRIAEGDLNSALLGCRLLVIDHPGSALHTAMAANVPTICFWNPDHHRFTPEAEADFARLRDAGILFDDPETAAAKVNAIADDVRKWWRSRAVQEARLAWMRHHARVDRFYLFHWLVALKRL